MKAENLKKILNLRHELHAHPELSMEESWTKNHLIQFLREHTSLEIFDQGRWFYAVFHAGAGKPNLAFRADMDAVPVEDPPGLVPYPSQCPGAGHKCGHDGHSASLAAFALALNAMDPQSVPNNVYLLFQHAEETGQGAAECVRFLKENNIAEIYAFHNLPDVPLQALAVPDGVAQFASKGMILSFHGVKSHASYPENGRNPAFAIADIISAIPRLTRPEDYRGLVLVTVIQVDVGERAFGTSAGEGQLLLTIRGEFEEELENLQKALEHLAAEKSEQYGLRWEASYQDVFPETRNHPAAVAKVIRAAKAAGVPVTELKERFRASEDFGHYTKVVPGAMFYLGDGASAPLHTAGFDFPDVLIETAVSVFQAIAMEPVVLEK